MTGTAELDRKRAAESNISVSLHEIVKQYGVTWGKNAELAKEGGTTQQYHVFFTARALWALAHCYGLVEEWVGREDGHLKWVTRSSRNSIAKALVSEVEWLMSLAADDSPASLGKVWHARDTALYEPVKTTAAVTIALLSYLELASSDREAFKARGRLQKMRALILKAVWWLVNNCERAVDIRDYISQDGSNYHQQVRPGWTTVPFKLQQEIGGYEQQIGAMMGRHCASSILLTPSWWETEWDCLASREAMYALTQFCQSEEIHTFDRRYWGELSERNILEALEAGLRGFELSRLRNDGWHSRYCGNMFAVLSLLQLPIAAPRFEEREAEIAYRAYNLASDALRETVPNEQVNMGGDICWLNGLLWVKHLLGEPTEEIIPQMTHWLDEFVNPSSEEQSQARPDYVAWVAVSNAQIHQDAEGELRTAIQRLSAGRFATAELPEAVHSLIAEDEDALEEYAKSAVRGHFMLPEGTKYPPDSLYSPSGIPGLVENRVFVGGNYDLMPTLREVCFAVAQTGKQPILSYDFRVPRHAIHDTDLMLLRKSSLAIFDVTWHAGELMELERVGNYKVKTLVVYQVRDQPDNDDLPNDVPAQVSSMLMTMPAEIDYRGYASFAQLRAIVRAWL